MLEMFQVPQGYSNLDVITAPLMVGFLPLIIGGAYLGGKLIGGYLKHKGEKKQAAAKKAADDERFNREQATWDVGQNRRVGQLNAVQGLLQRNKPFLRSGTGAAAGTGPDYTYDPEVLKVMQEKAPYPGSHGADPGAGLGYGALSGGANTLADWLLSGYASKDMSPVAGSALQGNSNILTGQADIDPLTGRPRVFGG